MGTRLGAYEFNYMHRNK